MKIFKVDFKPIFEVPSGLIIAAKSKSEANKIASETIDHTTIFTIEEVNVHKSCVIFYESGNY